MMNWVDVPLTEDVHQKLDPLLWAKKHCRTYITNQAVQKQDRYYYRFYFENNWQGEQDRLLFLLRWS